MVDAGVVHHRKCPFFWVTAACQFVQKLCVVSAANTTLVQAVVELFCAPVECPQHVDAAAAGTGIHAVGLTQRRPAALHVGLAAHARLVQVQQLKLAIEGRLLELGQDLAYALELAGIALFLSDLRPLL